MWRSAAIAVFIVAAPAYADPPAPGASDARAAVLACVSAAGINEGAVAACRGVAAQPCHEGAVTTHDMVMCASNEGLAWEEVMNASLTRLRAAQPALAGSLDDAQNAWRAYVRSECGYRLGRWGEGSGGRVVLASCLAQMTADRAVALIAYEQEGE